jgi:peptide/nickel transport system ATP-binding protein
MKRRQQETLKMSMLMITHDLGVVANLAEEVVVMYHGRVMEQGTLDHIFRDPQHPYLRALLRAVPRFDMEAGRAPCPDPRDRAAMRKALPRTELVRTRAAHDPSTPIVTL